MVGESPKPASTPTGAVFLSYASQDQEAAQRVCGALRAAGIEVWFDQSELRGGDVWDQKIRREIHDCVLFIPIISENTASRREGYFRLEWDLADQRSHRMARDQAFIVPICVDGTPGAGTDVPESFHRVQWTRLPGGEASPEFVARIKRLLSPEPPTTARLPAGAPSGSSPIPLTKGRPSLLRHALPVAVAVLVLAALAYLLINKARTSKPATLAATSSATSSPGAPPAAFNPPPHSIAVLPFVNLSGDPNQQYFSDGLTEELLNSLSRINELQVAGRTSSFYFKGEHTDLSTIAHKLNVATVLEGSVRRSAHTVRITAQLINAGSGFHLWSQTYDRPFGDVLKLQTEIANVVAGALKVSLLGDVTATSELGGTRSPAAFDAYLKALRAYRGVNSANDLQAAMTAYDEVLRIDPNYAHAYADRALLHWYSAYEFGRTKAAARVSLDRARADANRAIVLAPELAEGHVALAQILETELDLAGAYSEFERALELAPGSVRVLGLYGLFAVAMGQTERGLAASRKAVALDPLNSANQHNLGYNLLWARRYTEALTKLDTTLSLSPGDGPARMLRGFAYYRLGDFEKARLNCEAVSDTPFAYQCLALVYQKLGRHSDAEASFAKHKSSMGDAGYYGSAEILAEWGDHAGALEALEAAVRLRDSYLEYLTIDQFLDPLRNEPRFQAIERALRFPH